MAAYYIGHWPLRPHIF